MDTRNRSKKLLIIALVVLVVGTFCSLGRSTETIEPSPEVSRTPEPVAIEPMPTEVLVPTNQVEVIDLGEPLPPQVLSVKPGGGQELAPGGSIEINFDQPMDQQITARALQVLDAEDQLISGEVSWPSPVTLSFTPDAPLTAGSVYRASLSMDAASDDGITLVDPLTFDVNVAGDLEVSQVFPEDGATEVENNAVVTVVFNRPVVPLVIVEEMDTLPQPLQISPDIPGHGEWVNTSVYVYYPDEPLLSLTTYDIRVVAGLVDTLGAELAEDYEWQFTTIAPSIDLFGVTKPRYLSNPQDNYTNIRLESSFFMAFRQPMDKDSVSETFSLTSQSGEAVPVTMEWTSDTYVVITPTQQLALGTSYVFLLTQEARAATGGKLSDGVRWNFTTVMPPGVLRTYPENGGIQIYFSSRFEIVFTSPMDIDSITDHLVFTPEIPGTLRYYYDDWGNSISVFGLAPSTRYTVEILPGMTDIYGNPITEGVTVVFTTAARDPSARLELPYAPAIYRLGGPDKFYASFVNVSSANFGLYRLTAKSFADFVSGNQGRWSYNPPSENLVNKWYQTNSGKPDERSYVGIRLETEAGEALDPGFYFLTIDTPEIKHDNPFLDTRLLVVSDANLTFKTTQTEALMWLTDLTSGEPLEGVPLTVLDDNFWRIGEGSTNANGLLQLTLPVQPDAYKGWFVMTGTPEYPGKPLAFAYSSWGSGVSPYDFGIWSDYYSQPGLPAVYVYTDRPLYRPGQTVYFKGVVRINDDLAYSLPSQEQVEVTITSYEEMVWEETLPLTEFGTFAGELLLDDQAALGYYTLHVHVPGVDEFVGGGGFSVAEYRKPEFQVTTEASKTDVVAGEEFEVEIFAEYFSGGGVGNAPVTWGLQAVPYTFRPGGDLSRYSFSDIDRDIWYEGYYFESTRTDLLATGEGQTDGEGRLIVPLTADLSETGGSRQFTFEATVTDIAETSVSARTTVTAHQAQVYPGVRPASYVGKSNEEQRFDLVVVDWDGERVPEGVVDVEIVERRWYSVQEQDEQGYVHWVSSVEEITVTNFTDIPMNADGEAEVSFVPPNGGIFKAIVTTRDEAGHQARSSTYMWVSSSDYILWRQGDNRRIDLIADKDAYEPGEVAEILITHPFEGQNYALVTVERGHLKESDVLLLTSNSAVYQLPITAGMAPNVYLSVVVVQGAGEENPPDFRMGMVELGVNTTQQEIQVEIIPDRDQAGPGDRVSYTVRTTNMDGEPVQAELSLALADLATLSLSEPNSLPILDYFYAKRSLSVRTAVPIVLSIEHYAAVLEDMIAEGEGMGAGGGKGADEFGVFEVREDFPDTALWEAHIVTDENGEATVTVTLPDNLTTWRMDARAVTMDTQVGDSTNDIRSTKPLLVRPQTPRFFVAGDRSRLGAAVHNNTAEPLAVDVNLQVEGVVLASGATQGVEIPPGQQVYVTWEVTVEQDVERVDLVFSAVGGGYSDASRPTMGTLEGQGIPVYRYEAPETVGTAGMLTEAGSNTEAILLPSTFEVTQGDLVVKISPSLAAGMVDGLDFLKHYPYECTEQTVSRFLPNVLTTQALRAAGIVDRELEADLKEQVSIGLQRLYNNQRVDGGWGWWATSIKSNLLTSAYVVLGLSEAKAAGYTVSDEVLDRGRDYLRSQLTNLDALDAKYLLNRQTFLLYVLARSGEPEVSRTEQIYPMRQSLSLYARAYLAETLYIIDPEDPRLGTLVSDFVNAAILSATGAYWEETWRDYWNWNTDTRTTAIVLATLVQIDPDNALNANAVRWLMTHRTNGFWRTTQETAWTLMTLTRWMVATGELQADYDYAVGLNGERLGDGSATTETLRETHQMRVDVIELFSDQVNRLVVARDEGPGNLYYTAHLNVYLPVEEIEALDRGIIVSRSYYDPDDRETPVTQAEQGELLLARLTIVVPNSLHYVILDDPLPAGVEAVDPSLKTSQQVTAPERYDYDTLWERGWGWWYFDHVELRDERLVISADYLPTGTYVYTYLVRASTPGEYRVIPPTAQEFYFPEVYGRGEGSLFTVVP